MYFELRIYLENICSTRRDLVFRIKNLFISSSQSPKPEDYQAVVPNQ